MLVNMNMFCLYILLSFIIFLQNQKKTNHPFQNSSKFQKRSLLGNVTLHNSLSRSLVLQNQLVSVFKLIVDSEVSCFGIKI